MIMIIMNVPALSTWDSLVTNVVHMGHLCASAPHMGELLIYDLVVTVHMG